MNSIIEKHVFEFRSNLEQKSSVECSSDKMERRAVLLLLFVLLAERPVLSQSLNRLKDPIPVKVGVIIDMGTLVGKMCWTSISLAVDDIYAKNPNLTTRLVLYPRDGKADVMAAGSAALGLVNKEGVSAILGPQKSGQAKFLADIAGKARVPLLTFSATSPFLSSSATPYLLRTALSDSSQAAAVASVVAFYHWREATIIYEDTDYGNGVVPFLIDALQANSVRVRHRSVISPSATGDQIVEELLSLKTSQNRVFVVHLSLPLGERVFVKAAKLGMVVKGYAWIITDGIASLVDALDPAVIGNMQGFIGVKPHVRKSPAYEAFIRRWRRRYRSENPDAERVEPSIFSLWAYDATFALAMAVDKAPPMFTAFKKPRILSNSTDLDSIPESESGPAVLRALAGVKFRGVSGHFRLVNGQLQSSGYQIINVVGNGQKGVGFWTDGRGLSSSPEGSSGKKSELLGTVVWPGDSSVVPRGWEATTGGKRLRVGIPVKDSFFEFVKFETDPISKQKIPTGYSIEIFDKVMSSLPYPVPFDYVPYAESDGTSGSYDRLVQQIHVGRFDAVAGDVTITANRFQYVDFTLPYTFSGVFMIVPLKEDNKRGNFFVFMEPLTKQLWVCTLGFFILIGLIVWAIEKMENNENFKGPVFHVITDILYFAFSTAVFAHKKELKSWLSKAVVTVWILAVLILTSSYTASLASILTAAKLKPAFTDMEEVVKSGKQVGYGRGSFLEGLLKPTFGSKLIPLTGPDEYAAALANGTVIAVFHELPYIRLFLKKYCKGYATVGPTHRTAGFGFAFPKDSPILSDVSQAVATVTQGPSMNDIEKKWTMANDTSQCEQEENGGGLITLHSLRGLFIVVAGIFSAALVIACISRLLRCLGIQNQQTHPEEEESIVQDEPQVVHEELHAVQTQGADGVAAIKT